MNGKYGQNLAKKKPICDYNFDDEMLIKGKQQLS